MASFSFYSYLETLEKLKLDHITVPKEMVIKIGGIGTRLLCSINDSPPFHCGMVAKGEGTAYITVSKARQREFGISFDEELHISLTLDHSKYGASISEELEALLEQDRAGALLFEKLNPSQQRYIIHYVGGVKSSQKKIERAILLINNLKTMGDTFDFRHLLGLPPREY